MSWPEVTSQDVTDRWRALTDAEQTRATKRIEEAEAELRRQLRLRGVDGTPTFPTTDETAEWNATYIAIVADIAIRVLKVDPEGWTDETEAIDDYQRRRRRDTTDATVHVSDLEIGRLLPATARTRRGAFSIVLGQS